MSYDAKLKRPKATIGVRVFEYPGGPLIEDLGIVAGGNLTYDESKTLKAKLKRLKERRHGS